MNNNISSSKIKENDYIINEEEKLVKSYYFNYQEIAQAAAKKIVIKKVREIAREIN